MKKNIMKMLEILLLLSCFLYVILVSWANIDTIFSDFEYWGYPQWPWYMKDRKTFAVYVFFELFIFWIMFLFTLYNKYKKKRHYQVILYLNFLFYLSYVFLDYWLYGNI